MAWGSGKDVLVGIRKAAVWGTAIDVDAGGGIGMIVDNYTWADNIEDLRDEGYNNSALAREITETGRVAPGFTFTVKQKFQGLELPWALFMGTAGVPSGGGPYGHVLSVKKDMDGIFFTFAAFDGIKTHEFDSCKFVSASVTSEAGRFVMSTFTAIARKRTENSATNPNITSIAEPAAVDFVQWLNSVKDHQIAAKASSLADFESNSVTINMARAYTLEGAYVDEFIREPESGAWTGNVSIVRPYEDTTYIAPGAIHKLAWDFEKSASLKFGVFLPSLKVLSPPGPAPTDKGGITQTNNFSCDTLPTSAPSGFTLTVPTVQLTNSLSTDPLA